jgi:hypothetical protein
MVCTVCGGSVLPGSRFCSRCGAQASDAPGAPAGGVYSAPQPMAHHYGPPMMAPSPRVQRNLQTLGILWLVYAAYRVVAALIGMFVLHVLARRSWSGGDWPFSHPGGPSMNFHAGLLEALVPVIAVAVAFSVALALLAGYGLLNRKPWGRTVAIVAGILALIKFPMGTALGIYTLWVLAPEVSGIEYDALAERN